MAAAEEKSMEAQSATASANSDQDAAERERWRQVQQEYRNARKIAVAVWPEDTPPEVIQAATATILIQYEKHRPGRANGADAPALPPGPSECPECGGPIYDNRAGKLNGTVPAKRPDFKCKDPTCDWAQWDRKKKHGGRRREG